MFQEGLFGPMVGQESFFVHKDNVFGRRFWVMERSPNFLTFGKRERERLDKWAGFTTAVVYY